jgi:glycosyltransferase involved in cell wall biosynthesis
LKKVNPEVSVVIPLFNKQEYLKRAISSVLAQTYPLFELLIIDDGSTDASFSVASEILDPRVRIIRQENKGVSSARNRGVLEAQYDWVAFLDADDEWLPEFLGKLVSLTQNFPDCGIYGSAHYRIMEDEVLSVSMPASELPYGWEGIFTDYFSILGGLLPYNSSSVLISKEKLNWVGGFLEDFRIWEDTDTWMRLVLDFDAAFINLPLSIYHLEAKGRSQTIPFDRLRILERWEKMLDSGEIPEKHISGFSDNFLARYQLLFARSFLTGQQPKRAHAILSKIPYTSQYYQSASKLMRLSKSPSFIIKVLLSVLKLTMTLQKRLSKTLGLC